MTTQKLPAESQVHNGTTVVHEHADASPLRRARADALLQQIIDLGRGQRGRTVQMVALRDLCQQATSATPLIRTGEWTMEAVETAVNDLANAGTIVLEARGGEVMLRLVDEPPAPRRECKRPPAPPRTPSRGGIT